MPRELSLNEKRQLRDEIHRARLYGAHIDQFLAALGASTTREIDLVCQCCGRRELRHTRDRNAPGEIAVICDRCTGA